MKTTHSRAMQILLAGNIFLFALKLSAGLISHSLAVISDAFNSLTDIMGSIGIIIAIMVGTKIADKDHQFGHHRAEPIAGLIIAVLAGILGFEVIRHALMRLMGEPVVIEEEIALWAMGITIVVKLIMGISFYFSSKKLNSPAIKAAMVDAGNDVLIGFVVVAGIIGVKIGYPSLDSVTGLLVGIIVIIAGIKVGKENIDYLMGKVAPAEIIEQIKNTALSIKGVKGINDIFSHYVGNVIHVEVHIEVAPEMSTKDSHDLGKKVKKNIEQLAAINRAFIHIDPHY